jgi:peptidoglycan DL-endopeptidase CwlO
MRHDRPRVTTRPLAAWLVVCCACATGAPVGGVLALREGYQPFSRPAAPASIPEVAPEGPPLVVPSGARETAVETARALLGATRIVVDQRRYGDDCTALVRAAYARVGVDLMQDGRTQDSGVAAIYRFAGHHGRIYEGGRPLPGDLVFFRETYDRNRDGHVNDGLTHVGLVDEVEEDGTVVIIHRVARGVVRYRMNLGHPDRPASPQGRRWNDWLRGEQPGAPAQLTGQLFAGFATLLPPASARREQR